ncbi:MAG: D-alanine--D-alanine ligase [Planctomycetes bacterium]|nr:D-alanine--D-alanine ligase [Planctomycetota bacterium]
MEPVVRGVVAVLYGGPSVERDVSLVSGRGVAEALRGLGYDAREVDVREARLPDLPEGTEAAFLALHGTYGEDGGIQADLERLGLQYTGSGPEASRLAMDKQESAHRFASAGLAVPQTIVATHGERIGAIPFPPPWIVKPRTQGSSYGMTRVEEAGRLGKALETAWVFEADALIQPFLRGREVTAGVVGEQWLPLVELKPAAGFYDTKAKYADPRTTYVVGPDLPSAGAVVAAARVAFGVLGCRDVGRVDAIVTPEGTPVILEVNTLPGMTPTSLLPKAAAEAGLPYARLCERLLALALSRRGR